MSNTATISIRTDATLKQEAEKFFAGLGMSLTTAMNFILRETVRKRRIPFKIPPKKPTAKLKF